MDPPSTGGGNDSLGLTISFNTAAGGGAGNDTLTVSKGVSSLYKGDLSRDSLYFQLTDSITQLSTVVTPQIRLLTVNTIRIVVRWRQRHPR